MFISFDHVYIAYARNHLQRQYLKRIEQKINISDSRCEIKVSWVKAQTPVFVIVHDSMDMNTSQKKSNV